jgi:ATP-dependent Clp protease protease subunit
MATLKKRKSTEAYYTLVGDVNGAMVERVFKAVSLMTESGITTAHVLLQSHGGYVSDGICLFNFLSNIPIKFVTYNSGVVASIAVTVFLSGHRRFASKTARFMLHKSHASTSKGASPSQLKIISDGLIADDMRTESIARDYLKLNRAQWEVHALEDLHLTARQALAAKLIHGIGEFSPLPDARIINI